MNQLHSGELAVAPSATVLEFRSQITAALEEIVEVGARIRPLLLDDRRVGWLRGLYYSERKLLLRWYPNVTERTIKILTTTTTLTEAEIRDLDGYEFRTLLRQVLAAEAADTTLFPFVSPFVSTSASESLWFSIGADAERYNRPIDLLDGKTMRLLAPPDHCRLWRLLCNYREQAKAKLAGTLDASLVARALIGKGATKLINDLNKASRKLIPDIDEPWKMTIRVVAEDVNLNDGWGHAHLDTSEESVLREGEGMLAEDKHEQFMAKFYAEQEHRQQHEAEQQLQDLNHAYEVGVMGEAPRIISEKELRERELEASATHRAHQALARAEMESIDMEQRLSDPRSRYGGNDIVPIIG
jgi:hypothetical protein